MKISISMPNEVYESLLESSKENERTVSGEILYRVKKFNGDSSVVRVEQPRHEFPIPEEQYGDLIDRVGASFEAELDYDERAELAKDIKDAGLVWNAFTKKLEQKTPDGKFKLIHQF